jgi:hypothetical protein
MQSRLVEKFRLLRITFVFFLGVTSASALAQQQIPSTVTENSETVTTTTTTAPSSKTEPVGTLPESTDTKPATHFSPTEKIRADDAVPLPVDI